MSTTAEATEGQAKIRQLLTDLRYGHFDSDAIGAINSMLDQALAILDASPPIVGGLTDTQGHLPEGVTPIDSMAHHICLSFHHLKPFVEDEDDQPVESIAYREQFEETVSLLQYAFDFARDHGYLAQAPQSSPATVARVYTERSAGKWHAGLNIGNQSFTLHANEGTEEEANWFAEMLSKALAQSSPAPSVIEAGDAMENMMRRLRTQRDDEGILPTGNDFNGMDGLCAAWVAAKASRPSVTAPQGVTEDQIKGVISEVDDMHPYKVAGNADSYSSYNEGWSDACGIIEGRLSALLTNPK